MIAMINVSEESNYIEQSLCQRQERCPGFLMFYDNKTLLFAFSGPREIDDERCLVAIRELHAVQAVCPYLMGQLFFIHFEETELSEKTGLIGENEYPLRAEPCRLGQAFTDKRGAHAIAGPVLLHRQRTYLSQTLPADMKRAHASDGAVLLKDHKVAQMLVQLVQRARQHLTRVRVFIDERLYRLYIGYLCFTYHGGNITLFKG